MFFVLGLVFLCCKTPGFLAVGDRVGLGHLLCPWSVAAGADASSAFVSCLFFLSSACECLFLLVYLAFFALPCFVSVVCGGCAWGVLCLSFAFCLVRNVCVLQGGRSAACTRIRYLVSAGPCLSVLPVSFVLLCCAHARWCTRARGD